MDVIRIFDIIILLLFIRLNNNIYINVFRHLTIQKRSEVTYFTI